MSSSSTPSVISSTISNTSPSSSSSSTSLHSLLSVQDALKAFNELYLSHPSSVGCDISSRAREEIGVSDEELPSHPALTYGETPLEAISSALYYIETTYGQDTINYSQTSFLDIGSGTGKPVFAAALLRPWKQCIGVEILEPLYIVSEEINEYVWKTGLPYLLPGMKQPQYRIPIQSRKIDIEFLCGDISEKNIVNWKNISVAYACSTCFDDITIDKMATAASLMNPGTFLICSSVELDHAAWEPIHSLSANMSWGLATIFIHKRRTKEEEEKAQILLTAATNAKTAEGEK